MSAMTRRPSTAEMVRARPALGSLLGALQAEAEAGPAAAVDGTFERHRPAVRLGHVLHDREAQSGTRQVPRVVRSPEAIEHPRRVLAGHTRAVIAHRDPPVRDPHLGPRSRRAGLCPVFWEDLYR